ncbi:MAG: hypothetical protein Q4B14_06900 [Clostridia bacterium]|nr:hypothetical protein [Clostridia bacterium]
MAKKGYSRKGFFGQTIHYDAKGNKIGESTRGFWGQTNHYDTKGDKVGESARGFWGQTNHYDVNGNKKGESVRNFCGGTNHYDVDGNKKGYSVPNFLGGTNHYDWRNERFDGFEYDIYPENYETEAAYDSALQKAKNNSTQLKSMDTSKKWNPSLATIILIDIALFMLIWLLNS